MSTGQQPQASSISPTVLIMGNSTCRLLRPALARNIARSWIRKISGWSSQNRIPRQPRKGFSSCTGNTAGVCRRKRQGCAASPASRRRPVVTRDRSDTARLRPEKPRATEAILRAIEADILRTAALSRSNRRPDIRIQRQPDTVWRFGRHVTQTGHSRR